MKKVFGYRIMAPEGDGASGGGAGGGGAGGGGAPEGGDKEKKGGEGGTGGEGSILGDAGKGGEGGDKEKKGGEGGAGGEGSILGDAGKEGGDKEKKGGEGGDKENKENKEPTPEAVEEYVKKIKQIDFKGGNADAAAPAWDSAAVKTIAPLFIKHGISDAAANEIIAAYGTHITAQFKAADEANRAVLKGMRTECTKRFGNDLGRFAQEGRRGGEHVFGKALFQRLTSVEAFGSDPDIIEALAKIGRTLSPDGDSKGRSKGEQEEKSLAERMYGKK